MFFIDEFQNNVIKRKKYLLPINLKTKKMGSAAFLLTPNYESTKRVLQHPLFINRYFNSYYMERSSMYYINQESSNIFNLTPDDDYINEEALTGTNDKIIYHGFDTDTNDIMKIIDFASIDRVAKKLGTKINYPIDIEVCRNHNIRETTANYIYLNNKSTFDKEAFKNYNSYCNFNIAIASILTINPNINKQLMYAIALIVSDVYKLSKNNWNFDPDLKKLCDTISGIVKFKGVKSTLDISSISKNLITPTNMNEVLKNLFDSSNRSSDDIQKDIISFLKNNKSIIREYQVNEVYNREDTSLINYNHALQISNDKIIAFNEDATYNAAIKKMIYKERIRTSKELINMYQQVTNDLPFIKKTFISLERYKQYNLFIDLSYYNNLFIKNNTYKLMRGYHVYFDLMSRLLTDPRIDEAGYNKKTVIIPVLDWDLVSPDKKMWLFTESINPISCIYKTMTENSTKLKNVFGDTTFLFLGAKSYFTLNFNNFDDKQDTTKFIRNIKLLRNINYEPTDDIDEPESSPKAITVDIVDKVEKSQNVTIDNIDPDDQAEVKTKEINSTIQKDNIKKEIVKKVSQAANINTNIDDTMDSLDDDKKIKELLSDLAEEPDNGPKISAARTSRILKIQQDFLDKDFKDRKIKDILEKDPKSTDDVLPTKELSIDSVNDEWKSLKYANIMDAYNLDNDIVRVFNSLSEGQIPLYPIDIKVENMSNSEDAIDTYTVKYEGLNGERATVVVDIPRFINNRYMVLRGNRKEISSQLLLMPILKTSADTVQLVSFYNKIFVRRFGTTAGKSNVSAGKLLKALFKKKYNNLKITEGDNIKICSKYELPIDYIDLSAIISKIETSNYLFYFNQNELRDKYKDQIDEKNGLPIGIDKSNNKVIYYQTNPDEPVTFSYYLYLMISTSTDIDPEFITMYNKASVATRYTYSKASILNSNIPLIVVCAYSEGLEKVLKKAGIQYQLSEKRPHYNVDTEDLLKFKDGYLLYKLDYASSLLMNGLKACSLDEVSILDINKRTTYLNFLDMFGGRIKADGLDNFYDLMIDPITRESLEKYKLPTDYISLLLYANQLLTDNKYIKHKDISSSRRIRRNEQVANILYQVLTKEYGAYCTASKHGRGKPFSIKRSAIIDNVLLNNTTGDQSIINALSEYESYNAVTPKGPSGMNSDRSYSLDKRSYDDSMMNVLSMSTGFAGNVGITRQATIDANVEGVRGYVCNNKEPKVNPIKTLCMTEALTPFGITRDDPFRTAMTFVQTSKHGMRCRKSDPLLVTTGADEALPYLISDTFAFKAKEDGIITEKEDEYMIIEYKDKSYDYIPLNENIEKNSSSGFYVTLKLDTDLKLGSKVKKGELLAYDKSSFSNKVGYDNNVAYNIGTLCKFAILNTDEGYEDSAIISQDLSDFMTSDIVLAVDKVFSKGTNIYNMVKKGQKIEEGDTLMIIQNPYDEEDANALLRNLVDDEDEITNLGRINIKSKVTGVVQDIVISRTVDKEELSPSLKKIVTEYEKEIIHKKEIMKKYGLDTSQLPSTDKLPPTGKLKNAADGVLIEFYLSYEDRMSVGDKLIYYSALKGVTKDIFPVGLEPKSDHRPNEKLHSLLSIGSVNARMVTSILVNGAINKGLIELSRKCKDIAGMKYPDNLV